MRARRGAGGAGRAGGVGGVLPSAALFMCPKTALEGRQRERAGRGEEDKETRRGGERCRPATGKDRCARAGDQGRVILGVWLAGSVGETFQGLDSPMSKLLPDSNRVSPVGRCSRS